MYWILCLDFAFLVNFAGFKQETISLSEVFCSFYWDWEWQKNIQIEFVEVRAAVLGFHEI